MIYLDANATYPVSGSHFDAVAKMLKRVDGNPSSIHARGREAKIALEHARSQVARLIGARGPEIIFTSGATEANNLAIQGVLGRFSPSAHVVVSRHEHPSVLETVRLLQGRGLCRLSEVPVRASGDVDSDALLELVTPETALVCCMHGNNETGAINPVREIAARVKRKNPATHVHVDAVQMLGKADLTWYAASEIGSAAFSAHKLGAFKGVGALYLKPQTKLNLLIAGGGQERGRRPGTENMPGIVSFGIRAEEIWGKITVTAEKMAAQRLALLKSLSEIPGAIVHGSAAEQLPNTVNFHVEGTEGDDVLLNLDLAGVQASSGSACSSGVARPSHVLLAMGYSEWVALNSIRMSFTAEGRLEDIPVVANVIREVLSR